MAKRIRDAIVQLPSMGRWNAAAWIAAALLAMLDARLAALPLAAFGAMCLGAAFRPGSSFFLPVISRGVSGRSAVALTFDDGPDPLTTPELLRLLARHGAPATFFVTGERVRRHPELVGAILAAGHTVANHSYRHDPLGAFRRTRTIAAEITATQQALMALGVEPLAYRPPMGITSPRLRPAVAGAGLIVVNFSCRAWDGGNRRIHNLAARILKRVRANDILLLHEHLLDPAQLPEWAAEMESVLRGLRAGKLEIIPLAELIGRPVMRRV